MGKSPKIHCPHCTSKNIVQNGHPHRGKLQFLCNTCHKYFSEDTAKGYPPTNIPFPIIAYLLYFHKKVPELSSMRKFRRFVCQWLECLDVRKGDVSRQIIHHWIKNYEKDFESIISFREARDYCKSILSEIAKEIPNEVILSKSVPHTEVLRLLEETFGRTFCIELSRRDGEFFTELCDIISKFPVYRWKLLDNEQLRRSNRLFLVRSLKDVKRLKC